MPPWIALGGRLNSCPTAGLRSWAKPLDRDGMAEALGSTSLCRFCPGGLCSTGDGRAEALGPTSLQPPFRRPLLVLTWFFSLPAPSNITSCVSSNRIFFLLLLLLNFSLVCRSPSLSSLLLLFCHAGSIFFCARTWCPKFTVHAGSSQSQICSHWRFLDAIAVTPGLSVSQSSLRNPGYLSISLRVAWERLQRFSLQTPRI